MITEALLLIVFLIISYFICLHLKNQKRFEKHGIKYLPGMPIFGNCFESIMSFRNDVEVITDVYNTFPKEKYVGYFEGTTPTILIRDPELAKLLLLENSDHFSDHQLMRVTKESDSAFGNSLFMLNGQKWRDMKAVISPSFTPLKMRQFLPHMQQCSKNVVIYLKDKINEEVEMYDVMARYACDVVASTCFGLNLNSLEDRDNELYTMGISVQKLSVRQNMFLLLFNMFPNAMKKLKMELWPKTIKDFLRKLAKETIELRRKNNMVLSDMLQPLVEASNDWTLDELSAQLFFYYMAGFVQIGSVLAVFIHEIVLNSKIQEKLYEEISEHRKKTSEITDKSLKSLPYLDAAYNETLRKWAPTLVLDRICTKSFTLPPASPGAKPFLLQPGDLVYYAMNSVMLDPEYFPDPEKFDPDRFMNENKAMIKPYTFEPFGMGPRYCIGAKFVSQQVKTLIYNLILNFKFEKCADTREKIELDPRDFLPLSKSGTTVKLLARN